MPSARQIKWTRLWGPLSNAQAAQRYLNAPAPDMAEIREILSDVEKEGCRASEVVNRLRALLKKEKIEFEPLDLNSVFREVAALLNSDALMRNVKVSLNLDPQLPLVQGDRIQLQQVALNLMLNSFEAMIECASSNRLVKITTCRHNSEVRAAVADSGKGISQEKSEMIFTPFFTTKAQGLGMGLSICRWIILRHQGRIWLENNPDEGATFYFSLPAASA